MENLTRQLKSLILLVFILFTYSLPAMHSMHLALSNTNLLFVNTVAQVSHSFNQNGEMLMEFELTEDHHVAQDHIMPHTNRAYNVFSEEIVEFSIIENGTKIIVTWKNGIDENTMHSSGQNLFDYFFIRYGFDSYQLI